jgi:chromosome segregation ATPase
MLTDVRAQAQQTQKDIELNKVKYDETIETLEKVQDQISEMANINSQMSTQTDIMSKLANKQVKEVDIDAPAKELVDMTYDLIDIQDNLTEAEDQILYNNIASEMLKDTGIRTKIIKEYLPVMNNLINKYLQTLEFFVAFHLNENFEESIKSRHRDEFVYANFSEGEKMRIDLSLLFAWRQVAKMKNSTNTNLLILDETFDSSLDDEGTDNLMKILKTLEKGTNTFIISHKPDVLESKMEQKIQFVKKNNFSAIS